MRLGVPSVASILAGGVGSLGGVSPTESDELRYPGSAASAEEPRKTVQLVSTELQKSLAGIRETSESSLVA